MGNLKCALFIGEFPLTPDAISEELIRNGCDYLPIWDSQPSSGSHLRDVEVIVNRPHAADAKVIERWCNQSPELKMISLAFTGYDDVDLGACESRGLHVYYCPDYSTPSVAELTVALTLAVLRRIPAGDENVRAGRFDTGGVQPGIELAGKTIGILGTGTIGMHSSRLFRALGCQVIGSSRTRRQEFIDMGGVYLDRDDVLRLADVLVLHLALKEGATRQIIDARALRLMRPGAILINTARAALVDTVSLASALTEGRIAGAGIDVYDDEKALLGGTENPLLDLPNVVLTPHVGFKTHESLERLTRMAIANIARWRRNDPINRLLASAEQD